MINAIDKRIGYISYILEMEKSRYNLKKNAVYKGQVIIWSPKTKNDLFSVQVRWKQCKVALSSRQITRGNRITKFSSNHTKESKKEEMQITKYI